MLSPVKMPWPTRTSNARTKRNPNQTLGRIQVHFAALILQVRKMKKPRSAAHNRLRLHSFQRMAARDCGRNAFPIVFSRTAEPMIATKLLRINAPQNLSPRSMCGYSSMLGRSHLRIVRDNAFRSVCPPSGKRRGSSRESLRSSWSASDPALQSEPSNSRPDRAHNDEPLTETDGIVAFVTSHVPDKNTGCDQQYAADLHETKLAFGFVHLPASAAFLCRCHWIRMRSDSSLFQLRTR